MAVKSYKKGSSAKLSANFKVSEFDCNGKGCCTNTQIDEQLVKYLQKIREHFGVSVTIESGYRCKTHNAKISNSASKSKHMDGMAADIKVKGVDPAEVAKYAESIGVKGIGLYDTDKDGHFVHIDTRTSKFFWFGHAQEKRTTFGGAVNKEQEQFIRDVQKALGATATGVADKETLSKTVTLSAKKNRTHPAVRCVQEHLYALDYKEVGEADGIAGKKFTTAVKAFQKDNGCTADGEITAKKTTWKELLGMS